MNTQLDFEFDRYKKRFAKAVIDTPYRKMWEENDRKFVKEQIKTSLGITDNMIPEIKPTVVRQESFDGYNLDFLTFTSWENVIGTAHLYKPCCEGVAPVVFLCCGHGKGCKNNKGYQAMARRLAKQGAYVVVSDNIGQGEREFMGHFDSVVPFACGLSVQGLIVAESIGWINWIYSSDFADKERIAVIGNSGGGTLSMFLGALCDEIKVLSSSGYPSSFEMIAMKEKKHCHCNIIPHAVGTFEMDMVYSLFAPKEMFLFQGKNDEYFQEDLFWSTARKIKTVYEQMGKAENFESCVHPGTHSWNVGRRYELSKYLAKKLGLSDAKELADDTEGLLEMEDTCLNSIPSWAKTIDELAMTISGKEVDKNIKLWQVFESETDKDFGTYDTGRGLVKQIFAQFEAFLK